MTAEELNLIYHYGKEVHKNYFFFKVHTNAFLSDLLLVHKNPNEKPATVQDLVNTLKCRYAEKYQYVGYTKASAGCSTKYIIDTNPSCPLDAFAFLNLPPEPTTNYAEVVASNSAESLSGSNPEIEPRIYKLKLDLSRPMGPIVLEPARPAGEPIGPLEANF
jgi:hypothetical protein